MRLKPGVGNGKLESGDELRVNKLKEIVKYSVFQMNYLLYQYKILKNKILVKTIDQTIDELIHSNKSLVRFGDAEICIIEGNKTEFQLYDKTLAEKLNVILKYESDKILVGIPDIFENLDCYTKKSEKFWKEHLFFCRKTYKKYCSTDKVYENAFFSRPYYIYKDKQKAENWFERIKKIWFDKEIVVVEGEGTHSGVGNDLFSEAKDVERILCPRTNAYLVYNKIKELCLRFDKKKLFLLALGNTAKLLAVDLVENGFRAIDIGNLDLEYEWYLNKADSKIPIAKHEITGEEANLKAGYFEYWQQVKEIVKI